MTSIIKVQNIQYTDGDAALTIADGGGVTLPSALSAKGGAVFNEDSADVDFRVESNSNTHMLFVDGGNDTVGIGISNPASYCQHADELVVGGTDGNRGITIVGGDDDYSIVDFNRASNTSDTPNGAIEYNHSANEMYIKANALSALQLNSNGSVNKPYHPCFRASGLGGAWSTGINDVVHFANDGNGFNFDQGNNYNTSSNGFFAPVAGKYQFYAQALIQNGTNQKRIKLRKNGTDFAVSNEYGYNNSSEITVVVTGIVNMAANDKVDVHLNTQGGNYYNNHPYTFFQGFLIG